MFSLLKCRREILSCCCQAVLLGCFLLVPGSLALAGDVTGWGPDPFLCNVAMDNPGAPLSLYVVPDGSGRTLQEAQIMGGGDFDATITVTLIDYSGLPIAQYPREDMWLEAADGGLVLCDHGTVADASTDANGQTTWTGSLQAGGQSQAGCQVLISGWVLNFAPLDLHFNSADISGDLRVNLTDVSLFAHDFFLGYNYRSDFYWDGTINLSDLGLMSQSLGATCP
jgi:hypothetical protein